MKQPTEIVITSELLILHKMAQDFENDGFDRSAEAIRKIILLFYPEYQPGKAA